MPKINVFGAKKLAETIPDKPKEITHTDTTIKAVILIQNWYRQYRARLEARRRCSWMIYQSLECSSEQDQHRLYGFFNELLDLAESKEGLRDALSDGDDGKGLKSRKSTRNIDDFDTEWDKSTRPGVELRYKGPLVSTPITMTNISNMIQGFKKGQKLHVTYLYEILDEARKLLMERATVIHVSTSISKQVTVVGDLHGQLQDLDTILYKNGMPDITNPYIFNGDFVDRGKNSVETALILFGLLVVRPNAVFINRGNHEDYSMNCRYGFIKEIQTKYKTNAARVIKCFTDVFRWLPMATIIDKSILVCHGGISESTNLNKLENMSRKKFLTVLRTSNKYRSINDDADWKQVLDLLWSDPSGQLGCRANDARGGGCVYGPDTTEHILAKNNLSLIIRSHECKQDGFEWTHKNRVLTIFSASNYYGEGTNRGAYAKIEASAPTEPRIVQFVAGSGDNKEIVNRRLAESINSVEESALRNLQHRICQSETELCAAFEKKTSSSLPTGHVTLADWCSVLETTLNLNLPWRTLRPRIAKASSNGKTVDYSSMFAKIKVEHSLAGSSTSITEQLYKHKDNLEYIFRMIDSDNSGHISLQEFTTACKHLSSCRISGSEEVNESGIVDMARQLDLNGDGQIDFNEFLEAFRIVDSCSSASSGDNSGAKSPPGAKMSLLNRFK